MYTPHERDHVVINPATGRPFHAGTVIDARFPSGRCQVIWDIRYGVRTSKGQVEQLLPNQLMLLPLEAAEYKNRMLYLMREQLARMTTSRTWYDHRKRGRQFRHDSLIEEFDKRQFQLVVECGIARWCGHALAGDPFPPLSPEKQIAAIVERLDLATPAWVRHAPRPRLQPTGEYLWAPGAPGRAMRFGRVATLDNGRRCVEWLGLPDRSVVEPLPSNVEDMQSLPSDAGELLVQVFQLIRRSPKYRRVPGFDVIVETTVELWLLPRDYGLGPTTAEEMLDYIIGGAEALLPLRPALPAIRWI